MKTITVIYHSADFDGIFCREIARKFLPDAELIGWNFGDPPLKIPDTALYVLDLPLDAPFGFDYRKVGNERGPQHPKGLVWIDHHKSSIESHPTDISGYRIDGVAACRLAWQWFATYNNRRNVIADPFALLPTNKRDYVDRAVLEPWAVRLAGEYDIWDKRDPDAETFQYALRVAQGLNWDWLLSNKHEDYIKELLQDGRIAQIYAQQINEGLAKRAWLVSWEGLTFLALNTTGFNSLTFAARDLPETGHDALMGFNFNGRVWTVSLYHAKHRTDLDLSAIAKKYNGGGHKGACGFTCTALPKEFTEPNVR